MHEQIPIREQPTGAGKERHDIPLDENFFSEAESIADRIQDEERRSFLETGIDRAKRSSFDYTSWVLDSISGETPPPEREKEKEIAESPSHGLRDGFGVLRPSLSFGGAGMSLPKDHRKADLALENFALRYAIGTARRFRELSEEEQLSPEEIAARLHLPPGVDVAMLVKKIERLPPGVVERSIFENREQ